MFGLLKNKISGFINNLVGREDKKPAAAPAEEPKKEEQKPQPKEQEKPVEKKHVERQPIREEKQVEKKTGQKKAVETKKPEPAPAKKAEEKIPERKPPEPKAAPAQKKAEERIPVPKPVEAKPIQRIPVPKPAETTPIPQISAPLPAEKKPIQQIPIPTPKPSLHKPEAHALHSEPIVPPEPREERDLSRLQKRAEGEKHGIAPKIGFGATIKSFFSNEITIGEAEVSDLLEELELSLLEADVAYDVSIEVIAQLRTSLVGMKVPKGEVGSRTKGAIQSVLESVMDSDRKFDFIERVRSLPKPAKILFVGPNGAGKTTTMAKLARLLMDSGLSVVFSASDTFRAAAIEQTEVHGGKLGVKVIKSKYGADPASVAFDAINYARANSVDVVLIDSAGRQDTNANLLSELVKINRIAKPDIKIYIGESIGGNSVIDQIHAFNESIGMDGAILTKVDCDAKGGTAISIAKSTGIPVLFLGVGQGYHDLVPFDPHKVASEIMGG